MDDNYGFPLGPLGVPYDVLTRIVSYNLGEEVTLFEAIQIVASWFA